MTPQQQDQQDQHHHQHHHHHDEECNQDVHDKNIAEPKSVVETPIMDPIDYGKLAQRCLSLLKKKEEEAERDSSSQSSPTVFIAVAGTPGSGKSHIAQAVCDEINQICGKCGDCYDDGKIGSSRKINRDNELAVVIPMDGYHLTRNEMKELVDEGATFKSDQFGDDDQVEEKQLSYDELMARRGAAFTYCVERFVRDLKKTKQEGEGSFPVYDRSAHDPVPNGVRVTQNNKIVFVEGLYLLCFDDPKWKELDEIWDDKWFIQVSLPETKRRLVKRHLKNWDDQKTKQYGGDGPAAAARKADMNDMLNAKCIIQNSKQYTNMIIVNEEIPEEEEKKQEGEEDEINEACARRHEGPMADSTLFA